MNEIEADLAAIKARAEPFLAQYQRLSRILSGAAAIIITVTAIGAFFTVAERSCIRDDKINQEQITWKR